MLRTGRRRLCDPPSDATPSPPRPITAIHEARSRDRWKPGIGLEVVRQAVRSGYAVRALARSADRIPGSGPNLDKRVGSAIEVDSVAAVLPGVDAVVMNWACGSGLRRYSGPSGCSRQ